METKENGLKRSRRKYDIPVSTEPTSEEQQRIIKKIKENVFGQDRAIRRAVRVISIFEANLNDPQRPVGALMFSGPSGSGKTFTAKQLAYAWIGEPKNGLDPVVFIDCGTLSLEHERATLTGSPPGYVGYKQEVGLEQVGEYEKKKNPTKKEILERWAEKVAWGEMNPKAILRKLPLFRKFFQEAKEEEKRKTRKPHRSVVIFDEFEKAHVNVQKQLLNILEEGKLRLLNGRVVDFTGSLIIFTTNVGTKQILDEYLSDHQIGFKTPSREKVKKSNGMDRAIWERVKREIESGKYFLPELLGRIGKPGIIVFQTLKHADYLKILDVELSKVQKIFSEDYQFSLGKLSISYAKKFKDFLIKEGVEPKYGARALRNVVDKYVREPIANAVSSGDLKQNDKILLKIKYKTIDGEDGEKEEGETKILRQPRLITKEYPSFDFKKEEIFVDQGKIERMLDEELERLLRRPLR